MRVISCKQLQPWDGVSADIPAYIEIICDDESELPASPSSIVPGFVATIGSTAHVVSNQLDYEMKTNGQWVVKQTADVQSLVSVISQVQSTVNNLDADVHSTIFPALRHLVDGGDKNLLPFTMPTSSVLTLVDNGDGTFTLSGSTTQTISLLLGRIYGHDAETLFLSGCPNGGSGASGFSLMIADRDGSLVGYDEGNGYEFTRPPGEEYFRVYCRVRSGTYNNLRFRPMVTYIEYQMISSDFVPYSPTNAELYQLIRGYHP